MADTIADDVIALLRAAGPPGGNRADRYTARAQAADERGIPIHVNDAKRLREDLWRAMELLAMAAEELAERRGLAFDDIVAEWEVFTELHKP